MTNKLASFYLLIVTALWGLTFPLIEISLNTLDPFLFVSLRFTLAALPILFYFFKRLTKETLMIGSVLGIMNLGAFLFQTIGLVTVNASRAAFLTGIYVLLIPFLSPLFKMGSPSRHELISALICCSGIYVLTGCNIGQFTTGDGWIVGCAFFAAISIIYIAKHAKNNVSPYMLAYSQIVMTGLFSWIPTLFFSNFHFSGLQNIPSLTSLLICSFAATILAIILQCKYQKQVSVQNAALIFSLEPVFAALFDTLLTDSKPQFYTLIGGGIILVSILYLEFYKPKDTVEINVI